MCGVGGLISSMIISSSLRYTSLELSSGFVTGCFLNLGIVNTILLASDMKYSNEKRTPVWYFKV